MIKGTAGADMASLRWTSKDLDLLPDDGKRYEIVDGELYVSKQPHVDHQLVCSRIWELLQVWSRQSNSGVAIFAPGVIFNDDEDVAPDVVWVSREHYMAARLSDGKLHIAPELTVEVLSPGVTNSRRDREAKLKLYSRRGVLEYWIVNWQERYMEVYRRENAALKLQNTLYESDTLQSPNLPGFGCQIKQIFSDIR